MKSAGLRITISPLHLSMLLLSTCAIVNGLVDGWKGMGSGGSRLRSDSIVGRGAT